MGVETWPAWVNLSLAGLVLTAVGFGAALFWAYGKACDREDERERRRALGYAIRQDQQRHPVDRDDWRAPSERVV